MLKRTGWFPLSPAALVEHRQMPHDVYLRTPFWKRRSWARIRKAGGRCERCRGTAALQCRHTTYDRRGDERDQDLEVLCRVCADGRPGTGPATASRYLRVGQETARLESFETYTDFKEAFRDRCKQLLLSTTDGKFDDALNVLFGKHLVTVTPPRPPATVAVPAPRPISHAEAQQLFRQYHIQIGPRSFPAPPPAAGIKLQRERARAQLAAILCPQCRKAGHVLPSGMTKGHLWCQHCKHKWPMTGGEHHAPTPALRQERR